jgi:hypothetical protein
MMRQAAKLLDDELPEETVKIIVNYVYEQTLAHVFSTLESFHPKRTLALDVVLLEAIIILGRGPEKDPTPVPEKWLNDGSPRQNSSAR